MRNKERTTANGEQGRWIFQISTKCQEEEALPSPFHMSLTNQRCQALAGSMHYTTLSPLRGTKIILFCDSLRIQPDTTLTWLTIQDET